MFEPDAYERNYADERIESGWKSHNKEKAAGEIEYKPLQEEKPNEPMFQTLEMILGKTETEDTYIPTGITLIDKKMQGLKRGAISVVSGLRGSAKSTLLSQIILNVVDNQEPVKEGEEPKGHHVICYSGELSDKSFAKWMLENFRIDNETTMVTPAASFYKTPGMGKNHARIAYVLEVEELKKALHILEEGLKAYPGRTL
jgi:hypothetical protein